MPFERVLVANRGEIALRVFRTCARLGIETVAVVAPDDRGSLHARRADETVEIASYLEAPEILRAAHDTRADAIHPGYGFLAESAAFADAVDVAGLTWIGPAAAALREGGDKLAAKRIAVAAGVRTVPQGDPREIGYPLLVKAAAGGGGRGMRVVRSEGELEEALTAAEREAGAAFGDGTVFCERYLERPRHVEVQIVADGDRVHVLGLRDCSVQRRHQKLVEESPPPSLPAGVAERLSDETRRFAESIGYRNAGTAEFLVDGDDAFFLELNGRIQVEHPVTEEVTGLDLVELQLRVAAGQSLDLSPVSRGHAIEARLYAEDPRSFLPQAGHLSRLRFPDGIRVDAGVEEGDDVGVGYDPMLAKLIAHAATRADAIDALSSALAATDVAGVTTNLPFLRWLVAHPDFHAGDVSVAFLTEHPPLSAPTRRAAAAPFRGAWRLNLPTPPPAPPPDVATATRAGDRHTGPSVVTAPMPGTVIAVAVEVGDEVEARQPLVVLEAMKMETPVTAPVAARVSAVRVSAGDTVAGGAVLVELDV